MSKGLVACEYSQVVTAAFRRRGFEVYSCDILPTEGNPAWHIQDDVLKHLNDGWDFMIAHPPCTYLSHAGIGYFNEARWGDKARERKLKRQLAYEFFMQFINASIPHIAIENPVGYVNGRLKPTQIIQPYHFGDAHVKAACLWLKNLPRLEHPTIRRDKLQLAMLVVCDKPEPICVQYRKPSQYYKGGEEKKRYFTDTSHGSTARSKTFPGIARAMAEQWGNYLLGEANNEGGKSQ